MTSAARVRPPYAAARSAAHPNCIASRSIGSRGPRAPAVTDGDGPRRGPGNPPNPLRETGPPGLRLRARQMYGGRATIWCRNMSSSRDAPYTPNRTCTVPPVGA